MTLFKNKYRVESTRIQGYDYSQPGSYFITIVTYNRACLFGKILNGEMILNDYGEIVKNEWEKTGIIRTNIFIDKYIIMPNHLHGILIINDNNCCRDTLQRVSTIEKFGKPTKNSIPTIIRLFKSTTTKQINIIRKSPNTQLWQRNYYEHIIRDADDLFRIRKYIEENPSNWQNDENKM